MDRFKGKYRIPSTRLKEWNYAAPGYYFVTICTKAHQPFFGEIKDTEMHLSTIGEAAYELWIGIPIHFPNIDLDDFVIMPNHIHGIIIINEVETQHAASLHKASLHKQKPIPGSLSVIIRSYKSSVTRWSRQNICPDFAWQSRFYDHVIRDVNSLDKIRTYIRGNIARWESDDYFPTR